MNISNDISLLSKREIQVMNCILLGLANRDIAKKLYVSEHTVKYHCKNIYSKMQVKSRVELICINQA